MTSLEDSYAVAEAETRQASTSFFAAFQLLPRPERRGIYVAYAYSRRADDAVDAVVEEGHSVEEAMAALRHLASLLGPSPPEDSLQPALADILRRFSIPREHFLQLLLGMEMDLWRTRYATFDELSAYCYRAAAVVGLVCLEIFGYESPAAREAAVSLGLAMQMTNILRDVDEDLTRGRIYLPQEDLAAFSYSEEDLRHRTHDERFQALMRFEVERVRGLFARAEPLYALVRPSTRFCPLLLKRCYSRLLDRIEALDYDVFSRKPRLSGRRKLALTLGTWLQSRLLRASRA